MNVWIRRAHPDSLAVCPGVHGGLIKPDYAPVVLPVLADLVDEVLPEEDCLIHVHDWVPVLDVVVPDVVTFEILGEALPGDLDVVGRLRQLVHPVLDGKVGPLPQSLLGQYVVNDLLGEQSSATSSGPLTLWDHSVVVADELVADGLASGGLDTIPQGDGVVRHLGEPVVLQVLEALVGVVGIQVHTESHLHNLALDVEEHLLLRDHLRLELPGHPLRVVQHHFVDVLGNLLVVLVEPLDPSWPVEDLIRSSLLFRLLYPKLVLLFAL